MFTESAGVRVPSKKASPLGGGDAVIKHFFYNFLCCGALVELFFAKEKGGHIVIIVAVGKVGLLVLVNMVDMDILVGGVLIHQFGNPFIGLPAIRTVYQSEESKIYHGGTSG